MARLPNLRAPAPFPIMSSRLLVRAVLAGLLLAQIESPAFSREIIVTAPSTPVRGSQQSIATVRQGERFKVLDESGSWLLIEVPVAGRPQKGWIARSAVQDAPASASPAAAAPASSPAAPNRWLRVTAESANVQANSQTVLVLKRNQVLPIVRTDGRWSRVERFADGALTSGFVLDTGIEVLSETYVGPALSGIFPDAIATADVTANPEAGMITITAALPVEDAGRLRLLASDGASPAPDGVDLSLNAGRVTIRAAGDHWPQWTREGSSSLWVVEGEPGAERRHRIDLPAHELDASATVQKFASFTEGVLLVLPVRGLLPGYLVEHAYETAAGDLVGIQVLSSNKGASPRIADLSAGKGSWPQSLRVAVPFAKDDNELITHVLVIRAADGSQTRTLRIRRRGDVIVKAEERTPALPYPADVAVIVPDVALLSGPQAIAALRTAGLEGVTVDLGSFQPLPASAAGEQLVLRQGVPAGDRVLRGATILLGVRSDNGIQFIDDTTLGLVDEPATDPPAGGLINPPAGLTDLPPDGGLISDSSIINTGVSLQFIDVSQSGLIGGVPGLQGTNPLSGNGAGGTGLPGNTIVDAETPPGMSGMPGISNGSGSSNLVISVGADPGLLLDPATDPQAGLLSTIAKLIIEAILRQPDPSQLPGPIGAAITDAIRQQEAALVSAPAPDDRGAVVADILRLLEQHLQISLTDAQRREATRDWLGRHGRLPPRRLDRNRNGVAADDVVIALVEWLLRRQLYNPATQVVLGQDPAGNTVAAIPAQPIPPEWIDALQGIVKPGATPQPTTGPGGVKPQPIPVDPLASIPTGEAVVTAGDGPVRVRVPNVENLLVEEARTRLDDRGLRISNLAELFASDRVVKSNAGPGVWVAADAQVSLKIVRRVPDLLKLTLTSANAELRQHRLGSSTSANAQPNDIVTAQSPVAGSYVAPEAAIRLTLGVIVPNVTGVLLREARTTLDKADLKWGAKTRAFDADRVVAQFPLPASVAQHGDQLDLTVHLPVPTLSGLSLERARQSADQWDVQLRIANRLARNADTVRGQSPAAGTFVPHGSSVNVGPIVTTAPNLRGRTIQQAETLLKQEDFPSQRIGDLLGGDTVTNQTPAAGAEIERGSSITLDARVTIPNFQGQNIVAAADAIVGMTGNLQSNIQGQTTPTDQVYSQSPAPGTLVFPRSRVTLVPGVQVPQLGGLSPAEADNRLRQAGLQGRITLSGTQETTNRRLVGNVVIDSQRPGAGFYRRSDVGVVQLGTVQYILATRTVPNVIGDSVDTAVQRLQDAGFEPVIRFVQLNETLQTFTLQEYLSQRRKLTAENRNELSRYTVTSQDPRGGTEALLGARVTIVVEMPITR